MSKQDFLKTQNCVLRLNIDCDGCEAKVKKILQKIDGVDTVSIDTAQGKVTVTGNVDPSVLIKKLEKHRKYAQLWGPSKGSSFHPNNNQFTNLNNQFKNLHFDGGKMGKDNSNFNNNNNKSQKGAGKDQPKGGGGQQQQLQHQQLQQHQQLLQQQMKGGMGKDFKMPTSNKEQKSVRFNLPEDEFDDDESDGDEFDDEFDVEFDDEFDDEMEGHGMYGGGHGHHTQSKNIPNMGNGKGDNKKGKGGGGGEKKGKGGSGGAKKGGGGGGMVGLFKGMLGVGGGKNNGKKGKDGKSSGGSNKGGGDHNLGGGGKKGGGGHEGKMGKSHGGGNIDHKGKVANNGGGNNNNKSKGGKKGGGGGGDYFESDAINHGKNGGQHNIPIVGHPMGHNMPAAQPMINGGGAYYPGMGLPVGPYGNNPQQQQYMAMMMNQQRMNGGDGYGMYQQPHPMMYGRPPMVMPYGAPMVPPPVYHDPMTSYFSDENTNSCTIM